jgi:hypothetical protein
MKMIKSSSSMWGKNSVQSSLIRVCSEKPNTALGISRRMPQCKVENGRMTHHIFSSKKHRSPAAFALAAPSPLKKISHEHEDAHPWSAAVSSFGARRWELRLPLVLGVIIVMAVYKPARPIALHHRLRARRRAPLAGVLPQQPRRPAQPRGGGDPAAPLLGNAGVQQLRRLGESSAPRRSVLLLDCAPPTEWIR